MTTVQLSQQYDFLLARNKYFYAAVGSPTQSLHNTGTNHRWSTAADRDGMTLYVHWNEASQSPVTYNNRTFKAVNITGTSNSANIYAACQAAGMQTPCDVADECSEGKWMTVQTWGHLSYSLGTGYAIELKSLATNKFFYCNRSNSGRSYFNTVTGANPIPISNSIGNIHIFMSWTQALCIPSLYNV